MKTKQWMVLCAFGAALSALAIGAAAVAGDDLAGSPWDIAGVWTGPEFGSDGRGALVTITPTMPGHYNLVYYHAQPPQFPGETRRTEYIGPVERTGPDTFRSSLMSYIQGPGGAVIAIVRGTGELRLVDENTMETTDTWAVYAPGQDPYGADPPAYGCWGPWYAKAVRLVLDPAPCTS